MIKVGNYLGITVSWIDYNDLIEGTMPSENWMCFATSSDSHPNIEKFGKFVHKAVQYNITEFKGHGKFGELLHDLFDETVVQMETSENHPEIEVVTTWHNNESFADVLWQCFHANCLPAETDYTNLVVVCTDLDNLDRTNQIVQYIDRFKRGWLP